MVRSRPFADRDRSHWLVAAPSIAVLATVALSAAAIGVSGLVPDAERAVAAVALLEAGILGVAVLAYVLRNGLGQPSRLSFFVVAVCTWFLAANFLVWALPSILYRADILIWSEGMFMQDVLKLRLGAPLYGPAEDLSSFLYTPGAQLTTYAIAWTLGMADSVAALRLIQVAFVALAAVLGARAVWRISSLMGTDLPAGRFTVLAFTTLLLFLAGTNPLTNPFTHLLHNDSLSVLISVAALACLVEYAAAPSRWLLVTMMFLPALGFLVKQSLAAWLPLLAVSVAFSHGPRSWLMAARFALGAAAILSAVLLGCFALWGSSFGFWVFGVSEREVSPLRGVLHAVQAAPYFAAAIGGALAVGAVRHRSPLLGPWLASFLLLVVEAYTSGIAWMLNHLGPGSMLASVWLAAGLLKLWPHEKSQSADRVVTAASAAGLALLTFATLRFVTPPTPSLNAEHEAYAAAIEREFQQLPADRVLLDAGSWVYVGSRVVMRDRAAPVGDLGMAGVDAFSGILERIRGRFYQRIMVRDFDQPQFLYDHESWADSSGIREALLASYQVVRVIPGVETGRRSIFTQPIFVLEPREND